MDIPPMPKLDIMESQDTTGSSPDVGKKLQSLPQQLTELREPDMTEQSIQPDTNPEKESPDPEPGYMKIRPDRVVSVAIGDTWHHDMMQDPRNVAALRFAMEQPLPVDDDEDVETLPIPEDLKPRAVGKESDSTIWIESIDNEGMTRYSA
jgi:hypothetical protein